MMETLRQVTDYGRSQCSNSLENSSTLFAAVFWKC